MIERTRGKEKDAIAAKQLGVSEDYTIFMAANELQYFDEVMDEIEADEDGIFDFNGIEIITELKSRAKTIQLPTYFQMVGMVSINNKEGDLTGEVYGVVDFSEMKTCKQPMTEARAIDKFECQACALSQEGRDCDCVTSATCSLLCKSCGESIYFQGNFHDEDMPSRFACPYCKKTNNCIAEKQGE